MATIHIAGVDIAAVAQGYITAALWADCMPLASDPDHPDYDENWESGGLTGLRVSAEDRAYVERLCGRFVQENYADTRAYMTQHGDWNGSPDSLGNSHYTAAECFGHDLRMTSGGHGVGFWDRGLGDLGDRLSEACRFGTRFSCWGGGDVWQHTANTAMFDHDPEWK